MGIIRVGRLKVNCSSRRKPHYQIQNLATDAVQTLNWSDVGVALLLGIIAISWFLAWFILLVCRRMAAARKRLVTALAKTVNLV